MRNIVVLALMVLLCAGCGSDVDMVKNGTFRFDESLTIGNALDGYQYFSSTKWKENETSQGRKGVEFRGLVNFEEYPGIKPKDLATVLPVFPYVEYVMQFAISTKGDAFDLTYSGFFYPVMPEMREQMQEMTGVDLRQVKDEKNEFLPFIYKNEAWNRFQFDVAFLAGQIRKIQFKAQQEEAMAQAAQEAAAKRAAPPAINDVYNLEGQIAEFLNPPAPDRVNGEWALIGPMPYEQGKPKKYARALTEDAIETEARMFYNWLYLDYSDYNPGTPFINIAVSVVETIESTFSYYQDASMYDILVDGQKAGRIQFNARPSRQEQHVLLEQGQGWDLPNVHQKLLTGSRVSFVGQHGDRFDFDINGLAEIEGML